MCEWESQYDDYYCVIITRTLQSVNFGNGTCIGYLAGALWANSICLNPFLPLSFQSDTVLKIFERIAPSANIV